MYKATKPDQAAIIVWDTTTWRPTCRLESHSLTVTQLAFSHSGQLLLSVSRDRTWSLFTRRQTPDGSSDGLSPLIYISAVRIFEMSDRIKQLITITIRYDTIAEFNVDSKAEYTAKSSTRSQKLKQNSAPLIQYRLRSVKSVRKE